MVDMELESMFTAILNFFYYGENLEIHGYVQSDFSEQGISVTEKKILDRGLYEKSTCLIKKKQILYLICIKGKMFVQSVVHQKKQSPESLHRKCNIFL